MRGSGAPRDLERAAAASPPGREGDEPERAAALTERGRRRRRQPSPGPGNPRSVPLPASVGSASGAPRPRPAPPAPPPPPLLVLFRLRAEAGRGTERSADDALPAEEAAQPQELRSGEGGAWPLGEAWLEDGALPAGEAAQPEAAPGRGQRMGVAIG